MGVEQDVIEAELSLYILPLHTEGSEGSGVRRGGPGPGRPVGSLQAPAPETGPGGRESSQQLPVWEGKGRTPQAWARDREGAHWSHSTASTGHGQGPTERAVPAQPGRARKPPGVGTVCGGREQATSDSAAARLRLPHTGQPEEGPDGSLLRALLCFELPAGHSRGRFSSLKLR